MSKRNYYIGAIICLVIISILIFYIVPFIVTANRVFKKWDDLSKVDVTDSTLHLPLNKIRLLNLQTNKFDTISFDGNKLINFWAIWCKPCIEEMPSLINFQQKRKNIEVLLISYDSLNLQKDFLSKNNLPFKCYYISDTSVFRQPQVLPTTYLIKKSKIIKSYYGQSNWTDASMLYSIDSTLKSN